MKEKELKRIAEKIANAESIVQNSTDDDEAALAMQEIIALASKIHSLTDMEIIDGMIQEIFKKSS